MPRDPEHPWLYVGIWTDELNQAEMDERPWISQESVDRYRMGEERWTTHINAEHLLIRVNDNGNLTQVFIHQDLVEVS